MAGSKCCSNFQPAIAYLDMSFFPLVGYFPGRHIERPGNDNRTSTYAEATLSFQQGHDMT